MCLAVLSSSSPSPSALLKTLLIPESTGLPLDDSADDVNVTAGRACIPAGAGGETAAASCCEFKTEAHKQQLVTSL